MHLQSWLAGPSLVIVLASSDNNCHSSQPFRVTLLQMEGSCRASIVPPFRTVPTSASCTQRPSGICQQFQAHGAGGEEVPGARGINIKIGGIGGRCVKLERRIDVSDTPSLCGIAEINAPCCA